MNDTEERRELTNLAIISGTVTNDPQTRELPGGGVVVQFDVATKLVTDGRNVSVPVPISWHDPSPAGVAMLAEGVEVMVLGTVRRRFFRVGGATQSRTEVVAEAVIPTRRRKQVATALRETTDRLLAMLA